MQQTSKHGGIKNFFRYYFSSSIVVSEQLNRKPVSNSSAGIWTLFEKKRHLIDSTCPSTAQLNVKENLQQDLISLVLGSPDPVFQTCVTRAEQRERNTSLGLLTALFSVQTRMWLVFFATSMHCFLMLV